MAAVMTDGGVPYGTQIRRVAEAEPDAVAIIFAAEDGTERLVTFREFDERSTQLARVLQSHGLEVGDFLCVSLPNSPEHLMSSFAGWKSGAVVVPMRWDLPEWERGRVLATMGPKLVVDAAHSEYFEEAEHASTDPLADVVSPRGLAVCSSGSTGSPKVIVQKAPALYYPEVGLNMVVESYGALPQPQRVLVPAPLYHTNGLTAARNLMAGERIVLLERFNAERILDLIEKYRITGFIGATPMLQRLAQVPGIGERDLSSLDWVQQGAAPLPLWLGRRWCELVGPERFYLSYGASEMHGLVVCRGDQWLAHPGTLGLPFGDAESKILDADGKELPRGEIGGIYMRTPTGPAASYVGDNVTPMARTDDEFYSVGDLGWMDEEGFLFMADRRCRHDRHRGGQRLPGRGRVGLERAPADRRCRGGRATGSRVGPTGARHRPTQGPGQPARRRRGDRIRQGPPRFVQGAQDRRVHRLPAPQRGHEIESGGPRARARWA